MSEISDYTNKFRAIRVDNRKPVIGYVFVNQKGVLDNVRTKCYFIDTATSFDVKTGESVESYQVFEETIGRFAGLLDKNGDPVFVNQEVLFEYKKFKSEVMNQEVGEKDPEKTVGIVSWDEDKRSFILKSKFKKDVVWSLANPIYKYIEVRI